MPPRWFCILIVAGWLASTGPLLWKEWRRFFAGDQPLPYTIDPAEEYQGDRTPLLWRVHIGPGEPGPLAIAHRAESWVRYNDEANTYAFHSVLTASARQEAAPLTFGPITVRKMTSVQTVEREGRLRELRLDLEFDFGLPGWSVTIHGKVPGDTLDATVTVKAPGGIPLGPFAEPFALPPTRLPGGSALQPLHLVNRIRGLRPGQAWELPLLDPVKTSSNLTGTGQAELRYVEARVLPEARELPGHPDILCHVIEYDRNEGWRTWVQVGSDFVLRQEVISDDTRIVIQRVNLYPER